LIGANHPHLSISRQCELIGLVRSVFYYQPAKADDENLRVMEEIDREYVKYPFYRTQK
jgi:putative transposase